MKDLEIGKKSCDGTEKRYKKTPEMSRKHRLPHKFEVALNIGAIIACHRESKKFFPSCSIRSEENIDNIQEEL